MHISRSIRLPEDDPAVPQLRAGAVLALALVALVGLGSQLWLTSHGVGLPCGDDPAPTCALP